MFLYRRQQGPGDEALREREAQKHRVGIVTTVVHTGSLLHRSHGKISQVGNSAGGLSWQWLVGGKERATNKTIRRELANDFACDNLPFFFLVLIFFYVGVAIMLYRRHPEGEKSGGRLPVNVRKIKKKT